MSTHGNTVLPETFEARIPVAGCLKIGDVQKNGDKIRPVKLDSIRFCGPQPTKDGNYPDHPDFAEQNKAKLKKVRIELFSDEPTLCLEINRVMGNRGSVICKGNGNIAYRRMGPDNRINPDANFAKLPDGTCGDNCPFAKDRSCKLASTLRFRIPGHTPLGYVWQFRSTSWNTAQDLLGSMATIKTLTGGTLARLPLDLTISEQRRQVRTPTGKVTSTFWTVGLAFSGDELDLIDALERIQKIKDGYARLKLDSVESRLAAMQSSGQILSDLDDEDTARSFALEFFPDGEDGTDMSKVPQGTTAPAHVAEPVAPPAAAPTAPAAAPAAPPRTRKPKASEPVPEQTNQDFCLEPGKAYAAFYEANGYEGLELAFKAAIRSFTFHASNKDLPVPDRYAVADKNVDSVMQKILQVLEVTDEDGATTEMEATIERYADRLAQHGINVRPEPVKNTAPAAGPVAAPAPAAEPSKPYPHQELLEKAKAALAIGRESGDMAKLNEAQAYIRQLVTRHADHPGFMQDGKRIERDQTGADAMWSGTRTKMVDAIKAQKLPQVEAYVKLLTQLLDWVVKDASL